MTKTPKTTCVKSASPDPSWGSLVRKVLHEVRKGQGKGNEWEANESPERCLILVDVVVMGEEEEGVAVETKGVDPAEGEDLVLKKTGAFIKCIDMATCSSKFLLLRPFYEMVLTKISTI